MHNLIDIIETVVAKLDSRSMQLDTVRWNGGTGLCAIRQIEILSITTFEANPITLIDADTVYLKKRLK